MIYSAKLGRHIRVPIEQLNNFSEAELDSAIATLPGYPDTRPEEIRKLAQAGNANAQLIVEAAENGDPIAIAWL